ncbi:MAG: hypothetical protein KDC87_03250 [Planctomycetes bacterium]|nr:hypothetical protein [Planctomycetota bacterium]MCB9868644.1 hypothetical protein [Planctomycetota bacterium]MCB9889192.1 hypothetical protein [Planctomycetota bacterium]
MILRSLAPLALLALPLTAQIAPGFHVAPAVKPGAALQFAVVGQPSLPFACYADILGGPRSLLGEEIFLDLGPALTLVHSGTLDAGGFGLHTLNVPTTTPAGVTLFLQAIVLDPSAPNATFRASNGESTSIYASSLVFAEEFVDPVAQGYTGTFDATRRHRLQGAPVRYRLHTVEPQVGMVFQQGVLGPLNPNGARVQMVYRAAELGATGKEEVLVAMRWRPFGSVSNATFQRFEISVGHTNVVPDYTVDPFSALPKFPNSGLNTTYAQNPKVGDPPRQWSYGAYTVRPQDLRPDGYLAYPQPQQRIVYNGFDSLLLDIKTYPVTTPTGSNGQTVQLMVLSSPQPNGRVHQSGSPTRQVDPSIVTSGQGDNAVAHMQFEFAIPDSVAVGPWRAAPVPNPDYHTPMLATSLPTGTNIVVEFMGATSPTGAGATGWTTSIDLLDGMPYLRMRIHLFGDAVSGAVPSVESIVIPIN